MERRSQVAQAVLLFLKYAAAAIVACITASLVFIVSVVGDNAAGLPQIAFFIPAFLAGFTGVFAGAFCLPRRRQLAGSIVLILLAVGFSLSQIPGSKYEIWDVAVFVHSIFLATGGAVAVVFFFTRRQKNQSLEQADTPPLKSTP